MSEAEKPARRFWQIHLSTAVLLTLLIGAFLLANLGVRRDAGIWFPGVGPNGYTLTAFEYGFPWNAVYVPDKWESTRPGELATPSTWDVQFMVNFAETSSVGNVYTNPDEDYADKTITHVRWKGKNLGLNCVVFMSAIIGIVVFSEWLIRGREVRKQ